MRKVFVVLAALLMAAGILQFYFAGVGAFTKPQTDSSYALHSINGMMVIPGLSVLATIAAALARAPGRTIALSLAPFGLVIVQVLLIVLGEAFNDTAGNSTPFGLAIVGLHALNGMAVIGASGVVLGRARALAAGGSGPAPVAAESTAVAEPT